MSLKRKPFDVLAMENDEAMDQNDGNGASANEFDDDVSNVKVAFSQRIFDREENEENRLQDPGFEYELVEHIPQTGFELLHPL